MDFHAQLCWETRSSKTDQAPWCNLFLFVSCNKHGKTDNISPCSCKQMCRWTPDYARKLCLGLQRKAKWWKKKWGCTQQPLISSLLMMELFKQQVILKIHPHASQKKNWSTTKSIWRVTSATDLEIWKVATLLGGAARKMDNISTANTSSLINTSNPHLEGSSWALNL